MINDGAAYINCIRDLRKTGLPLRKCVSFTKEAGNDFDKAMRLAEGLPLELTEEELEEIEDARYVRYYDSLPFYSKEKTEHHPQGVECPHCDKVFYCKSFGAGG